MGLSMDRGEISEALEDLQGRLDIAPEGILTEDEYHSLSDAVSKFQDLLHRRKL